ncbi:HIT family protein [Methanospirillum sp.]
MSKMRLSREYILFGSSLTGTRDAKDYLDLKYSPDGYNIGINDGIPAGKTVIHLHIHAIPRYSGDMADPKGGVRGVIPEKQKY